MLNVHQFDIKTLSETWLKDNANLLNVVDIPGYNKNFRNRDRVKGGGVGYYVKTDIEVKERNCEPWWNNWTQIDPNRWPEEIKQHRHW